MTETARIVQMRKLAQEWRDQAAWMRERGAVRTSTDTLESCARQLDEWLERDLVSTATRQEHR